MFHVKHSLNNSPKDRIPILYVTIVYFQLIDVNSIKYMTTICYTYDYVIFYHIYYDKSMY